MWLLLTDSQRYFISCKQPDLTEDVQRRLVPAAEIYTEAQPDFWRLTRAICPLEWQSVRSRDAAPLIGSLSHPSCTDASSAVTPRHSSKDHHAILTT
ncbi:hypothetical protein [Pantoea ananatis]|uniref:hypothetical protein n=1 Tax=Pantoea ananas TaxID=553 RepID=UPI003866821E